MSFSYKFSNLLGSSFGGGNLSFTSDGNTLLSPMGNRTQILDLLHNRSLCLAPENRKNISINILTSDSRLLLSIDSEGLRLFLFDSCCLVVISLTSLFEIL